MVDFRKRKESIEIERTTHTTISLERNARTNTKRNNRKPPRTLRVVTYVQKDVKTLPETQKNRGNGSDNPTGSILNSIVKVKNVWQDVSKGELLSVLYEIRKVRY